MMTSPAKASALSILQHLHSTLPSAPPVTASDLHGQQIAHKQLFLRPTSPDPTSQDARSIRRKKRLTSAATGKRRPARLSAKQKRVTGIYDLELRPVHGSDDESPAMQLNSGKGRRKTKASWSVWKGLWQLWCSYVWEVFDISTNSHISDSTGKATGQRPLNLAPVQMGPKVASMDLHGAYVKVVKSSCTSLIGISGVCVRETKFSLVLVDQHCVVRRVGKRGAVFGVEVPLPSSVGVNANREGDENGEDTVEIDLDVFIRGDSDRIKLEISGRAIECRPADRATKKFKGRKYDGL